MAGSQDGFRGKIAAQARRDIDKLHGHFAMSANFLAGERIEFCVEVVTPLMASRTVSRNFVVGT